MAATHDLHEDDLKGSDGDDVPYEPKILKTFKVGIDRITSIAAVNASDGFYTAVCNNNSNELTFCDKDGEIIVRNLISVDMNDVRDLGFLSNAPYNNVSNRRLTITTGKGTTETKLKKCENPSESPAKSLVNYVTSETFNVLSTEYITGIYSLQNNYGIVACHASEQSYEPTSQSRRFVALYTKTSYSRDGVHYYPYIIYNPSPSLIIEYKHSTDSANTPNKNKERLFTYPKRVTQSDIGDLWIVDRKSPNRGDIKVCDIKGNLKFTYNGGPIGFKFDPMGVYSNQEDLLVIADSSNHKIHLVKNDGMFIRYLMTEQQGLQLPTAICVDVFQRAWVGCDEGTVHIIRYFPKFE